MFIIIQIIRAEVKMVNFIVEHNLLSAISDLLFVMYSATVLCLRSMLVVELRQPPS